MDFKLLNKFIITLITLYYQILNILALKTINNGYLKVDTIKLHNNLPINYEIIDLNELLSNDNPQRFLVKFVQTSSNLKIFKYLKYDDMTSKVLLSNKLDFIDLCNTTNNNKNLACNFNLQLIILNKNKFIELPIEILDV